MAAAAASAEVCVLLLAAVVLGGVSAADDGPGVAEGVRYEMVWIAPGRFGMGSAAVERDRGPDEIRHDVQISRGFYMGVYEVTQGLWTDVMGSNPSSFSACGRDCPVERVSWFDAVRFANALSERDGYSKCYEIDGEVVRWVLGFDCNGYRLPTEAEWEYAARGGQAHVYAGSNTANDVGWYNDNSSSTTHPVGGKSANGYGLYDMSGNVYEWCWDRYGSYPTGRSVDPVGPSTGSSRVERGGAWFGRSTRMRVAFRSRSTPSVAGDFLGLRLARSD